MFREACEIPRNRPSDLQRIVEGLEDVLLCTFQGFLNEKNVKRQPITKFNMLAESMRRELHWNSSEMNVCCKIHYDRNAARYHDFSPEPNFLETAIKFVRCHLQTVGVRISESTPSPNLAGAPESPKPEREAKSTKLPPTRESHPSGPPSSDEIEQRLALIDVKIDQANRAKGRATANIKRDDASLKALCMASVNEIKNGNWGLPLTHSGNGLLLVTANMEDAKRNLEDSEGVWDALKKSVLYYSWDWLSLNAEINASLEQLFAETKCTWRKEPGLFPPEPSHLLSQIHHAVEELDRLEIRLRDLRVEKRSLVPQLSGITQREPMRIP
jgi:hypothetical protein